jgi:hypothetical protein
MPKGSFAERCLEAESHRAKEACHDDADNGLESEPLGLLDAFAPPSQMLKIRPQLGDGFGHLRILIRK